MKKYLLLTALSFAVITSSIAQTGSKYGTDSVTCITNISLFNEYFKQNNYVDALEPWRWVFTNCPASTKRTYLNGATMFEKLIADEKDPAIKSKYLDSLLAIYDQRIKYFGEEGLVLGKKALAIYDFAPERKEDINALFKKSVAIEGPKSGPAVLYKYFQVNTELFAEKKITKEDVIDVYDQVSEQIDANLDGPDSANYDKSRMNVETFFGPFATCEDLVEIYTPRLKATPDDVVLLRKIVNLFGKKGCNDAAIYMQAAENLHKTEPTAKASLSLARMYAAKGQSAKASTYYTEAAELESDNNRKANIVLETADFNLRTLKNYSQARTLALRAAALRPGWGRPYIMIGDIYASSSTGCPDEFSGASVFWAAVDKYQKAKSVDPSLADEANRKIGTYTKYFPKKDDVFFNNLKVGDSYTVKCWINETTTIRVN